MIKKHKKRLAGILILSLILSLFNSVPVNAATHTSVLKQGDKICLGQWGETDLIWRVLTTTGETVLLLDDVLMKDGTPVYKYFQEGNRTDGHNLNEYIGSTVQKWLNEDESGFDKKAFSEDERSILKEANGYGYAYLLNYEDVINNNYGFSNSTSDSAKKVASKEYWWISTLKVNNSTTIIATINGSLGRYMEKAVTQGSIGVRPALKVDLSTVEISSGAGTLEEPYRLPFVRGDKGAFLTEADDFAIPQQEPYIASINLPNNSTSYNFENKIKAAEGASWKVYKDSLCTEEAAEGLVAVDAAYPRKAYLKVTAADGQAYRIYTITFNVPIDSSVVFKTGLGTESNPFICYTKWSTVTNTLNVEDGKLVLTFSQSLKVIENNTQSSNLHKGFAISVNGSEKGIKVFTPDVDHNKVFITLDQAMKSSDIASLKYQLSDENMIIFAHEGSKNEVIDTIDVTYPDQGETIAYTRIDRSTGIAFKGSPKGQSTEDNPSYFLIKSNGDTTWKSYNVIAGYTLDPPNSNPSGLPDITGADTLTEVYECHQYDLPKGRLKFAWKTTGSRLLPIPGSWGTPHSYGVATSQDGSGKVKVNFMTKRDLPGLVEVKVDVGDYFNPGDILTLRYSDGWTGKDEHGNSIHGGASYPDNYEHITEMKDIAVDDDGYIEFEVDHGGNFELIKQTMDTGDIFRGSLVKVTDTLPGIPNPALTSKFKAQYLFKNEVTQPTKVKLDLSQWENIITSGSIVSVEFDSSIPNKRLGIAPKEITYAKVNDGIVELTISHGKTCIIRDTDKSDLEYEPLTKLIVQLETLDVTHYSTGSWDALIQLLAKAKGVATYQEKEEVYSKLADAYANLKERPITNHPDVIYDIIMSSTVAYIGEGTADNPLVYLIGDETKASYEHFNVIAGYNRDGLMANNSITTGPVVMAVHPLADGPATVPKDDSLPPVLNEPVAMPSSEMEFLALESFVTTSQAYQIVLYENHGGGGRDEHKLNYSWKYYGNEIAPIINPEVDNQYYELGIAANKSSNKVNLDFACKKAFPATAEICLDISKFFADGDSLTLNYIGGCSGGYSTGEIASHLTSVGGYVTFRLSHGGTFELVKGQKAEDGGNDNDGNVIKIPIEQEKAQVYSEIKDDCIPYAGKDIPGAIRYFLISKSRETKVTWKHLNTVAGYDWFGLQSNGNSPLIECYENRQGDTPSGILNYSWLVYGGNLTPIREESQGPYFLDINLNKITEDKVKVMFTCQRDWPGPVTITLDVGDYFKAGDELTLTYKDGCGNNDQMHGTMKYDSNHTHNTVIEKIFVSGRTISFEISHGGNFELTRKGGVTSFQEGLKKLLRQLGTTVYSMNQAKEELTEMFKELQIAALATFSDVPANHWAAEAIKKLVNKGIMSGYEDDTFKPTDPMTRSGLIKALLIAENTPIQSGEVSFDDIKDHWAKDYIYTANMLGITSGINEKEFGPERSLTREEIAVMVCRSLGLEPMQADSCKDNSKISSWARGYVEACKKAEFITGYKDNTFRPRQMLTRAETAVIISRILERAEADRQQNPAENPAQV